MTYYDMVLVFLSFCLISCYYLYNKIGFPIKWPFLGNLPAMVKNFYRINDFFVEILEKKGLTFTLYGPWFTNMDILLTADPSNVHHVLSKNFHSYERGSKFKDETCDFLGETIINSDFETWQYYRNQAQSIFGNPDFQQFFYTKVWDKVEDGLIPVLDHVSERGMIVDLQDLFSRFAFDVSCSFIMDHYPRSLSIDWPTIPSLNALDEITSAIFRRAFTPTCVWKFQRWVGVGKEKKLKEACQIIDAFIYEKLARKKGEIKEDLCDIKNFNNRSADMLTLSKCEQNGNNINSDKDDKFYRDSILSLLLAGRDTTSVVLCWFFYLLTRNPHVLSKIKDELGALVIDGEVIHDKNGQFSPSRYFKILDNKLVYLHAALCEALRLYPPIPYEIRNVVENDVLPSGHQVNSKLPIVFSIYAMARMKSIWGDDCREFKPERWINENGKIRYEASYKFLSFMAGPRTCLGKNMGFTQLKAVATTVLRNYNIQAVEGHPIVADASILLRMKYGFKAKLMKSFV